MVVVSLQELIKAPVIKELLEPQTIPIGETATFTATFDGYPNPVISWYYNGREIQPSDVFNISSQKNESTLTISRCTSENVGKYEVRAMNEGGEARSSASIKLRGSAIFLQLIRHDKNNYNYFFALQN